jgi:uncharacterized LabA/DUF88 family protein
MSKKAIFFFDANNWYHNIKKYFNPSEIDIKKLAEFFCKVKDYDLIEIRWYASVPSIEDGENIYYKHVSYLDNLEKKGIKVIKRKLQKLSNKEILKQKQNVINGLDLCDNCEKLVEAQFLDLADIKRKEKGIDMWIGVDMIDLSIIKKKCDVCVLISGDADFVPALNILKENNIEILTSMTSIGYSKELIDNFPFFIIRKETLLRCLKDYPGRTTKC